MIASYFYTIRIFKTIISYFFFKVVTVANKISFSSE